jgi:hypothetical protein
MRLDCFLGHAELPADLSVCASRCHQLEHLEFASTGLRPAFVAGRDERKGPSPLGSRTGCQVKPGRWRRWRRRICSCSARSPSRVIGKDGYRFERLAYTRLAPAGLTLQYR